MASELSYYLIQFLSNSNINLAVLALFVSYLIWEIPRLSKMLEEEWLKGLYPEQGRVLDLMMLLLGIGAFLYLQANLPSAAKLAYMQGYSLILAAGLVALPVILLLSFVGRFFSRMDAELEVAAFLIQTILDLVHTVFFVCFVGLLLPSATLLFSSFL